MTGFLATGLTVWKNFGPQFLLVSGIAFSLGNCTGWKATQLWYRDTVADLETTLAEVRAEGRIAQAKVEATEKAGESLARGISDALDQKLDDRDKDLDGALGRLSRVKLCRDPGSGAVPEATGPAGEHDAGAGGDELPRTVGEALGHDANAADTNTDKLIACQAYVREVLGLLR